jgi:hypothetical protein
MFERPKLCRARVCNAGPFGMNDRPTADLSRFDNSDLPKGAGAVKMILPS